VAFGPQYATGCADRAKSSELPSLTDELSELSWQGEGATFGHALACHIEADATATTS
jgi:hypothetical protein